MKRKMVDHKDIYKRKKSHAQGKIFHQRHCLRLTMSCQDIQYNIREKKRQKKSEPAQKTNGPQAFFQHNKGIHFFRMRFHDLWEHHYPYRPGNEQYYLSYGLSNRIITGVSRGKKMFYKDNVSICQ